MAKDDEAVSKGLTARRHSPTVSLFLGTIVTEAGRDERRERSRDIVACTTFDHGECH